MPPFFAQRSPPREGEGVKSQQINGAEGHVCPGIEGVVTAGQHKQGVYGNKDTRMQTVLLVVQNDSREPKRHGNEHDQRERAFSKREGKARGKQCRACARAKVDRRGGEALGQALRGL